MPNSIAVDARWSARSSSFELSRGNSSAGSEESDLVFMLRLGLSQQHMGMILAADVRPTSIGPPWPPWARLADGFARRARTWRNTRHNRRCRG